MRCLCMLPVLALAAGAATAQEVGAPAAKSSGSPTESSGADRLATLVRGTGLKVVALEEGGRSYGVPFEPRVTKGKNAWVVVVQYANPESKKFVLVFAVLLRLPDPEDVPKRLLRAAMDYNSRVPGSKVVYNKKDGTIDVQYEIPTDLATPELLAWAINDVAATCDDNYDRFAELVRE